MFNWLFKIVPKDYSWKVALKKVSYGIGKLALAGLAYGKAAEIQAKFGVKIDPETFQNGITSIAFGGLEALHDWLRMKLPHVKWL